MDKKATFGNGERSPGPSQGAATSQRGKRTEFQRIFAAAPYPVTVHEGPDHVCIFANPAYRRLSGHQDPIGRSLVESTGDLGESELSDRFDGVFRSGRAASLPVARIQVGEGGPNPRLVWLRRTLQPWLDEEGTVAGVISFAEDVEAREADHAKERRFEHALAAGRVFGTFSWDVAKDVVLVDERLATIFGVDLGRAEQGLPLAAFIERMHPDDRDPISDAISRAVETGEDYEEEYRIGAPGEAVRWVLARGRCLRDAEGAPSCFTGVVVDITRRKRTEDDLERSNTILRLSLESGGMGVWQIDIAAGMIVLDPTMKTLFGIEEEGVEFPIEDLNSRVHPDDAPELAKARARSLENGKFQAEFRILRPNGEVRWIRSVGDVQTNADGEPLRAVGVNYDITDQRRAEDSLRESERRFRSAFENAAVGCAYGSTDGRFVMANEQLGRMTGYTRDELLGMSFQDLTHPDYVAGDMENRQKLVRGEIASYSAEKKYLRKDGTSVWGYVSVGCLRRENGEPEYLVAFVKDISEQKAAEAALRESEQRLSRERAFLDAVIEIAPVGISIARDPKGEPPILNREARRMMNVGEFQGDLDRYEKLGAVHPDGTPYEQDDYPTVRSLKFGEESYGRELIYRRGSERRRWLVNSRPLHGDRGEIIAAVTAFLDVEDQRRLEEHRQLLIDELNHRVKNTLAVVQGLAQQTFSGETSIREARIAFEGRLHALAATHELLTKENWAKTTLETIATEALHSCDGEGRRTFHDGPAVTLTPKQAVTVTMALHELCTNAMKYGSLSNQDGRVELSWRTLDDPEPRLHMVWRETEGPPVVPPEHRGFGTRLIERALAAELEGDVRLDFRPEGLVCTIDAPMPYTAGQP